MTRKDSVLATLFTNLYFPNSLENNRLSQLSAYYANMLSYPNCNRARARNNKLLLRNGCQLHDKFVVDSSQSFSATVNIWHSVLDKLLRSPDKTVCEEVHPLH